MKQSLGQRLKARRLDCKLTMAEVQQITCIEPGSLSRIENDIARFPYFYTISKLIHAYDMDADEIKIMVVDMARRKL